jgi:AcrR family transcriptional regulator
MKRNEIGQVMGRKGHDTRARLVAAAERLIGDRPLRELRVSDIAREAGLGPSHFYVYFRDVGAAVLSALEQQPQSSPEVMRLLAEDWTVVGGLDHIRGFVAAYLDFWRDHHALLRARNLAADEGDPRFVEQRLNDIGPILSALATQFARSAELGLRPAVVHSGAAASVLLAALERLATGRRWVSGEALTTFTEDELREAAAYVVAAGLGLRVASR